MAFLQRLVSMVDKARPRKFRLFADKAEAAVEDTLAQLRHPVFEQLADELEKSLCKGSPAGVGTLRPQQSR